MGDWILLLLGALVILLLLVGASVKPFRFIGRLGVKFIIAALFLFLFNSLTTMTGLFVPINLTTTAVVALLGLPGMALLVAVQQLIL
ncbi:MULTISPECIES: pro-sigmaK processing inhibitor BofA family protein [Shouchella]|uniref:Pro-sigmaK processing inhibitor BofA family protein n=2 Tax=Shouchella TaxID=2893057 RepID=A0ABY7WA74_9BACI|nr:MULTISPECIES: pro-sigmaK processing inhibitor BofA family protein [Shouchella]MED4126942.1 pro-sigmaK processing inhibitor BofA family protein [Shouchella miscanthi]WDF05349.1 pro-sigmaK processing inhibitor BofA family protein [Shouchella hunanensis]GAF23859.1 inhibitor of pro-sigmaK processing BofA [Bacillus sp. JCM 19047]